MKKIFLAFAFLFCAMFAFSQAAVDTNDSFYPEAQRWELLGLTDTLPLLRPYPLYVIERVLNDVIANGSEADAELAKSEYERIFSKPYGFSAYGKGIYKKSSADEKENSTAKDVTGELAIGGDARFHKYVSLGYKIGLYGETKDFEDYSPMYTNKLADSIYDTVDINPFTAYWDWNVNLTVGTETLYGTAGLNRIGFGPLYGEGLALNDTGYHSANFLFNYSSKNWSFTSLYETIGTTRNIPKLDDDGEDGLDLNDGKHLAFHAIRWNAFKKFNVTYYENVVFGPNTNISYFIPAPYMALQNIGGAQDNLQMGLLFEVKPFAGFNWATDFFADDIDLPEAMKFNFDSKLHFGFQTGVIYSPKNNILDKISLNYTAIMPYTYAHWEYDDDNSAEFSGKTWNYQNYTNAGINIGSTLDPDSDRISFNARLRPTKKLILDLTAGFTRHANYAEDFSDEEAARYLAAEKNKYSTDGTLSMVQMFESSEDHGEHVPSAWDRLGFMTSDHKMYVVQAGLNGEYELAKTKYGKMSLTFGYTFEYIKNAGVNRNVYPGGTLTGYSVSEDDDGNKTYTADGKTVSEEEFYSKMEDKVNDARQKWIDNLYDCTNHYISVGFKYQY